MRIKCNSCPRDVRKTEELKLKTINGRDYLLCKKCFGEENYEKREPEINRFISDLQKTI